MDKIRATIEAIPAHAQLHGLLPIALACCARDADVDSHAQQAIGGAAFAGLTQYIVGRCRANAGNGAERRYFTERAVEPK